MQDLAHDAKFKGADSCSQVPGHQLHRACAFATFVTNGVVGANGDHTTMHSVVIPARRAGAAVYLQGLVVPKFPRIPTDKAHIVTACSEHATSSQQENITTSAECSAKPAAQSTRDLPRVRGGQAEDCASG